MGFVKACSRLLLAVVLVGAPLSYAELPVTVTVGGSQHLYDGDREVDDELLPFGAIEYRFNERWATEFYYSAGETDADNNFADDADIDNWHLDGLYYLEPDGVLHPYLAFGAGELKRDWDVDADFVDTQLNAGAGFRYYLNDHWSWRADARWLHSLDESANDIALSLGISYGFAPPPSRKRAAPPEPTPAPAPIDSDGDGVFDPDDECPGTPAGVEVDERGCEIVAPAPSVASIKLTVLFGFDSDQVDTRFFQDIEGLANFLNLYPEIAANIQGHTDSRGNDDYNMSLSQRRADAVREILVSEYGIDGSRLKSVGYGETQPVASNDTDEGRAENRRVIANLEVAFDE